MPIKAVLFDFMGTCLDWHTSISNALPHTIPEDRRSRFALEWRQTYFDYNAARLRAGEPPEDIDISPQDPAQPPVHPRVVPPPTRLRPRRRAWHRQPAWPDVRPALERLRAHANGYELFVHANGTTRLQLDLVAFAGLRGCFDALFSSELLGVLKPAPENYEKCLGLLRYKPAECVTVAAHAYDTRGAKKVGMKTVYVYRWTDDVREDQEVVRGEHDVYLESMDQLVEAVAGFG
ncbi:(S)-2-haloacid dehalogenase IVA [Mycena vitilis]|nr:(S)-2-haloacid dehalogenase IVA [Mycena vitilis]